MYLRTSLGGDLKKQKSHYAIAIKFECCKSRDKKVIRLCSAFLRKRRDQLWHTDRDIVVAYRGKICNAIKRDLQELIHR